MKVERSAGRLAPVEPGDRALPNLFGLRSGASDQYDAAEQFGGRLHAGLRNLDATTDDLNQTDALVGDDETLGAE